MLSSLCLCFFSSRCRQCQSSGRSPPSKDKTVLSMPGACLPSNIIIQFIFRHMIQKENGMSSSNHFFFFFNTNFSSSLDRCSIENVLATLKIYNTMCMRNSALCHFSSWISMRVLKYVMVSRFFACIRLKWIWLRIFPEILSNLDFEVREIMSRSDLAS